jgi:hypothetical protein
MQAEPQLAFRNRDYEAPGLEIVDNFGVFAGREATPAEIDELAAALLPEVGDVSIVSEQRHEIGEEAEAALHQVRVEVAADDLPSEGHEVERLSERLVAAAERWATDCISERHAEVTEL